MYAKLRIMVYSMYNNPGERHTIVLMSEVSHETML